MKTDLLKQLKDASNEMETVDKLNEKVFLNFKLIKGIQNEVCKPKGENTQNV